MEESILNHLFLPHYLPSSANADYLIRDNHQYENEILECMDEYLNTLKSSKIGRNLPIFPTLKECIERWSRLQDFRNFVLSNIQSTIDELPPGSFLPLYFNTQNAAILIEIDQNNSTQPLISAWQVLLPSETISSSLVPYFSCFPVTTYKLHDRSQLTSKVHCELLTDFMYNTIEYSKSYRSSHEVDEIREVPQSHYLCQWWIEQFEGIKIEKSPQASVSFKKKHRDQIRWNKAMLPFRRSGLWMTVKVVLHTILVKRLNNIGTVVYKLLITHFLTYVICTTQSSIDLLIHCVRKIVRRLNKIEKLLLSVQSTDLNEWIKCTKQHIQLTINQIIPKSNWQNEMKIRGEEYQNLGIKKFQLNDKNIYQHSCVQLKIFLNNTNSNEISADFKDIESCDSSAYVNQSDCIPSYDVLIKQMKCTIGVALTYMEIWIESYLKQWFHRNSSSIKGKNCFELLLRFFEEYQKAAVNHYYSEKGPTDPIGYSRFILTSLTIIHFTHEKLCQDEKFERLRFHSIYIPNLIDLFEFLVLPNRSDMIRARNLYDFFTDFHQKQYPDLLDNIESQDAFGVYYAAQSPSMNQNIQKIRLQAEKNKQSKIKEVNTAREKYNQLMDTIRNHACKSGAFHRPRQCDRCKTIKKAKKIKVTIFECPMPEKSESALAVIFELQMPIEIRCYREILWQFVNRTQTRTENHMYEWLRVPPHDSRLKSYNTGPEDCKVKLVSSVKSLIQTHYKSPPSVSSTSLEGFLFENSLNVHISPTKPVKFDDEHLILTPQLDHSDYKQLQFTINSTHFVQNHVIAQLTDCPARLKPTQFVEFGSFRSGHRLQWWNLLIILEMDSLSIAEESVAILITHSLLQYGPLQLNSETSSNRWCPESHEELLDDHFVDELLLRLDHRLDDCESNWQNELVLMVITTITMRILTICNSTRKFEVAHVARKCRKIGEKWIDLIAASVQTVSPTAFDEVEKLRIKMINIGVCCILTFSTQEDRITDLLSTTEDVISLLKAATTIHDNIILSKTQSNMSTFMRNMLRYTERVLVIIQPTITIFLEKTSYESLNQFVVIYWAVMKMKADMKGHWKKRTKYSFDGWYDCRYESRHISIDCIRGTFLVDGMTIGFLPEKIISNEIFIRIFDQHVFEVQAAESSDTYITKHSYHNDRKVFYEFRFNDRTNDLIIKERHMQTNDVFQLIPHKYLETELPDMFVSNHSHWLNIKDQVVEFRPVSFKATDFLNDKAYMLTVNTGYITTEQNENTQLLINQSSSFFKDLFLRYFARLDDKPYVYMMRDIDCLNGTIIFIYLSRLMMAFQYNINTNIITSREYPDMCVDNDQWLGTLKGLTSGLLLSPLSLDNNSFHRYPYRKLIVPFGEIHGTRTSDDEHQTVTVQRLTLSKEFFHQYFVFILNDRLRILQSTDSPTGWLYLALLHAMTSRSLPDEYTGMTGMERAFQLLKSAGCYSDQPFDSLSLNILTQIASISPKVNYYPEHLTCMQKIDWNSNGLTYSMQHFGYYLIVKNLINATQQLNFMYSSSKLNTIPEFFEGKLYNEALLKKLYWDYRDSYNPIARLSAEMEEDIMNSHSSKPYYPTPEKCSRTPYYPAVRLVDDLYSKGDVVLEDCSNRHWLPLSQWLTNENQLKNIWIGLLKLAISVKNDAMDGHTIGVQRFRKLLNFLHYVSATHMIKPFYLQMLKTVVNVPTISLRIDMFPSFIEYQRIEETSFIKRRIKFTQNHPKNIQNQLITEIEKCWTTNTNYLGVPELTTFADITQINTLFSSWRSNRNFRSFLESVQNLVCTFPMEPLNIGISYNFQGFTFELPEDHYRIQIRCIERSIDDDLLSKATRNFHNSSSNHFDTLHTSVETDDHQSKFPTDIFTSISNKENSLEKINNYFKNQLSESWKRLLSSNQHKKEYHSTKKVNEFLMSIREESDQFWSELVKSITSSNELSFDSGLITRITPTTVIPILQQQQQQHTEDVNKSFSFKLTKNQCTLLGGTIVNWVLEQQMERALYFFRHNKHEDFISELSNTPHSNWIPSEHVSWLILELEMNIIIRDIQIKVAQHMIQPNMTENDLKTKNIVMQMNMGEGKTSVILPMLAVNLSSFNSSLVRIVVLKSLFPTNYQSLRYKLGGLLNRRIFPFACRRDMNLQNKQINQITTRLKQALRNGDVILTSPEDILSFDLLTIDKCRRNEFDTGRSMLTLQRWLKTYMRDVLDESDEILHVKYQLIYTIGTQQQVDGGAERWKTIQIILDLVKKHAENISNLFKQEVCYKSAKQRSAFPQFRLQSHHPYPLLCENIVTDWIKNKNYRQADKEIILSFILKADSSIECIVDRFPTYDIQLFLIIRGLLSSEVLLVAFKKRYRVNYGIASDASFHRLMAVPYRAKDVATDRTEFGHPDVALVLTQLLYYYSGLNDRQLTQCFDRLSEKESDPSNIYEEWIQHEDEDEVPTSIKQWKMINLKDYQQRTHHVFPMFRYNMLVVNYFLNHFVFPREARQFPHKIVSSAWDLSSSLRSKIITGFSGTNDTQLLLPVDIRQYDLPELQKTDAIVVKNLIHVENERYQSLTINATSEDILKQISNSKENINVILDVGALFVDGSNRDIAIQWLNLCKKDKIDYAVYFDLDSIVVCDRQFRHHRFETSPASERLDHCVFYLDEIHTRGTDFKFPNGFRAVVTLGNGLTKDRFVQACMRMRKLGNGHSLTFWSSNEVCQQITALKKQSSSKEQDKNNNKQISVIDILRWVYQNTMHSTWEGLHHWAEQSLSFQRKRNAFQEIAWQNDQQKFTDTLMKQLSDRCLESEATELKSMYGPPKILNTIDTIYIARYQLSSYNISKEIHNAVKQRLHDYGGTKQYLSNLLDEEQQRELEHELEEERQMARPSPVKPCDVKLHDELKRLCNECGNGLKLNQLPAVFRPLSYAFTNTTFFDNCQPSSWQKNLWISTEFQRVIITPGESLNSFLRPPRWIVVYRNEHIIFISAFEANWLMGALRFKKTSITTLRLLLPRIKRIQSIFVNTPALMIPRLIEFPNKMNTYFVPVECLAQLCVFNGTLYFETIDEQETYCECLGLCAKPRTIKEIEAFEKGWIDADGFVRNPQHRRYLHLDRASFTSNPLAFVRQLIENRNNTHPPIISHVGSIIFNSQKLILHVSV